MVWCNESLNQNQIWSMTTFHLDTPTNLREDQEKKKKKIPITGGSCWSRAHGGAEVVFGTH